jgi:hypothetical protein
MSPELAEAARRGKELYETRLKKELEQRHHGEFVVIEPVSGDYFVARKLRDAGAAAATAYPDRYLCTLRIGHAAAVDLL